MTSKWSWIERQATHGDEGELVIIGKRSLAFEDLHRRWRHKPPAESSVKALASDILKARHNLRGSILLHYSYWPSMMAAVLTELYNTQKKRKTEIKNEERRIRRRMAVLYAPPARFTPSIIALPDGNLRDDVDDTDIEDEAAVEAALNLAMQTDSEMGTDAESRVKAEVDTDAEHHIEAEVDALQAAFDADVDDHYTDFLSIGTMSSLEERLQDFPKSSEENA